MTHGMSMNVPSPNIFPTAPSRRLGKPKM
jgi:hypothetical protein